jgi:hypothetical protein
MLLEINTSLDDACSRFSGLKANIWLSFVLQQPFHATVCDLQFKELHFSTESLFPVLCSRCNESDFPCGRPVLVVQEIAWHLKFLYGSLPYGL